MKICIVAWDIIGASKTTGVGTFNYEISGFLRKEGHDVTLLYTQSVYDSQIVSKVERQYADLGIRYFDLQTFSDQHYDLYEKCNNWPNFNGRTSHHLAISDKVRSFLDNSFFDAVIFSECNGNGYRTVQAKRTGISFQQTKLICVMHGSLQWCKQGMEYFDPNYFDFFGMSLNHCEQYSAEHCDYVVSPSSYMLQWAEKNEWNLSGDKRIIPYIFESAQGPSNYDPKMYRLREITFFGRLEVRKGLHLFLDAVNRLKQDGLLQSIEKINFIGPGMDVRGIPSSTYIADAFQDLDIPYTIQDMPHHQLEGHFSRLCNTNLVVMPSTIDNLPFTIIEMIHMGTPFIASKVGGIPELLGKGHQHLLFEPTVKGIYEKISEIILNQDGADFFMPHTLKYHNNNAKQKWRELLSEIEEKQGKFAGINRENRMADPITVIISGNYNPDLIYAIKSLHMQSCDDISIFVILELPKSKNKQVYDELQRLFPSINILTTSFNLNALIRSTISSIATKYVILMDTTTIADYHMTETFHKAIKISKPAALTSYHTCYVPPWSIDAKTKIGLAPIGGSLLLSLFENIFEDPACIIDRQSFLSSGGFDDNTDQMNLTWDIFSKLMLKGFEVDTIPKALYASAYRKARQNLYNGIKIVSNNFPRSALNSMPWGLLRDHSVALHRLHMTGASFPSYRMQNGKDSSQEQEAEYPPRAQALITLFGHFPFAKTIILWLARLHYVVFGKGRQETL